MLQKRTKIVVLNQLLVIELLENVFQLWAILPHTHTHTHKTPFSHETHTHTPTHTHTLSLSVLHWASGIRLGMSGLKHRYGSSSVEETQGSCLGTSEGKESLRK